MEELRLYSPFSPVIDDLERHAAEYINSFSDSEREEMYKSYTDDYIQNREDYEFGDTVEKLLEESENDRNTSKRSGSAFDDKKKIYPVKFVIEHITGVYNALKKEQFSTICHNNIRSIKISDIPEFWIQPIVSYIPDEGINIRIIDDELNSYNYVRTRLSAFKDKNGNRWFFAVYNPNPKYMPDVREQLLLDRLIHYSPEYNHDDIMDTGLIPSKGGRTYMYPDERVFFYVYATHGSLDPKYVNMMSGISNKIKKNDNTFSGIFNCYELDVRKIPKDVKILYDPNADNCVYLNIHIQPEWIKYQEDMWREF